MLKEVIKIVFPEKLNCLACGDEYTIQSDASYFCEKCITELQVPEDRCSKCDRPVESVFDQLGLYQHKCKACQEQFHYYTRHLSCTRYEGTAKKLIMDFKYKGKVENAKGLAEQMYRRLQSERILDQIEGIVPTPIHWTRRWTRGFNQSELIAKALNDMLKNQVEIIVLKRCKKTKKLKNLNKDARKLMLKDAIILSRDVQSNIENKKILIIDDIYTTGATVDACSKVLYEAGAEEIYCITFAMGQ